MSHECLSRSHECGILKISQSFLFFSEDRLWDFWRLWICVHKPFFSLWVQMRKRIWDFKGMAIPLIRGFQ